MGSQPLKDFCIAAEVKKWDNGRIFTKHYFVLSTTQELAKHYFLDNKGDYLLDHILVEIIAVTEVKPEY